MNKVYSGQFPCILLNVVCSFPSYPELVPACRILRRELQTPFVDMITAVLVYQVSSRSSACVLTDPPSIEALNNVLYVYGRACYILIPIWLLDITPVIFSIQPLSPPGYNLFGVPMFSAHRCAKGIETLLHENHALLIVCMPTCQQCVACNRV